MNLGRRRKLMEPRREARTGGCFGSPSYMKNLSLSKHWTGMKPIECRTVPAPLANVCCSRS